MQPQRRFGFYRQPIKTLYAVSQCRHRVLLMIEIGFALKAGRSLQHEPVRGDSVPAIIQFGASIADAIESHFNGSPMQESAEDDLREMYAETHLALAQTLLFLLGEPNAGVRLEAAERRLRDRRRLAVELKLEDPFDDFANCLNLLLLSRYGLDGGSLGKLLKEVCTTLRVSKVDPRVGNNIFLMHRVTERILRPAGFGQPVGDDAIIEILNVLDRYRSREGFYFDKPRDGSDSSREFPPTYCLKFLFQIGICYLVTNDRRFAEYFSAGMRAVVPLMANTAGFSYFGRSDNTTFGRGLALFNLRLAKLLDGVDHDECEWLWKMQAQALQAFPRTRHGWLRVNGSETEELSNTDRWGRDTYTYSVVYSAACICYVLLGELLAGCAESAVSEEARPDGEARRPRVAVSRDLGLVRLARPDSELLVRCSGSVVRGERRHLAPTLLRWERAGKLVIGAIPCTTEDDARVAVGATRYIRKRKLAYLAHLMTAGMDELRLSSVGFLPFLTRAAYLCAPLRLLRLETNENRVTGYYATSYARYRGMKPVARELAEIVNKNLGWAAFDTKWDPVLIDDMPEFSRTVSFDGDCVKLQDNWSNLKGWRRLRISTRLIRGNGKAEVSGLDFEGRSIGWSGDGETILDLYGRACSSERLAYEITVTA